MTSILDRIFFASKDDDPKDSPLFETTRTWECNLHNNKQPAFVMAKWNAGTGDLSVDLDGGRKSFITSTSTASSGHRNHRTSRLGVFNVEGHRLEIYLNPTRIQNNDTSLNKDQRLHLVVDGSTIPGGPCDTISGLTASSSI